MNKEAPKRRLGRPPGSLNKKKPESVIADTVIKIPKALAQKITSLAEKTGVNSDRIALGALVDGLKKWEGVHEVLINYNESINELIRESGTGPRKRTRPSVAPSFTVSASPGDAIAMEDTLGLESAGSSKSDHGTDNASAGSSYLAPSRDALFGRGESEPSPGDDQHFEQFIHGE